MSWYWRVWSLICCAWESPTEAHWDRILKSSPNNPPLVVCLSRSHHYPNRIHRNDIIIYTNVSKSSVQCLWRPWILSPFWWPLSSQSLTSHPISSSVPQHHHILPLTYNSFNPNGQQQARTHPHSSFPLPPPLFHLTNSYVWAPNNSNLYSPNIDVTGPIHIPWNIQPNGQWRPHTTIYTSIRSPFKGCPWWTHPYHSYLSRSQVNPSYTVPVGCRMDSWSRLPRSGVTDIHNPKTTFEYAWDWNHFNRRQLALESRSLFHKTITHSCREDYRQWRWRHQSRCTLFGYPRIPIWSSSI